MSYVDDLIKNFTPVVIRLDSESPADPSLALISHGINPLVECRLQGETVTDVRTTIHFERTLEPDLWLNTEEANQEGLTYEEFTKYFSPYSDEFQKLAKPVDFDDWMEGFQEIMKLMLSTGFLAADRFLTMEEDLLGAMFDDIPYEELEDTSFSSMLLSQAREQIKAINDVIPQEILDDFNALGDEYSLRFESMMDDGDEDLVPIFTLLDTSGDEGVPVLALRYEYADDALIIDPDLSLYFAAWDPDIQAIVDTYAWEEIPEFVFEGGFDLEVKPELERSRDARREAYLDFYYDGLGPMLTGSKEFVENFVATCLEHVPMINERGHFSTFHTVAMMLELVEEIAEREAKTETIN